MITKEQAMTANEFHEPHGIKVTIGPRGKKTYPKIYVWRRNGKTQTWKTRPLEFRIPIKYGLYSYDYITHYSNMHASEDCPLKTVENRINELVSGSNINDEPYLRDA